MFGVNRPSLLTKGRLLQVELQAVCLVVLSFFRDREAAVRLADTVAEHRGVLGAAVCCAENGGSPRMTGPPATATGTSCWTGRAFAV